jgi:hypothetical protein
MGGIGRVRLRARRPGSARTQGARGLSFRFLGVGSLGWSTIVEIVEASEEDRLQAIGALAAQLLAHFGAPDVAAARLAAEDEITFAASLCDHPPGTLAAVSRSFENGSIREAFRALG